MTTYNMYYVNYARGEMWEIQTLLDHPSTSSPRNTIRPSPASDGVNTPGDVSLAHAGVDCFTQKRVDRRKQACRNLFRRNLVCKNHVQRDVPAGPVPYDSHRLPSPGVPVTSDTTVQILTNLVNSAHWREPASRRGSNLEAHRIALLVLERPVRMPAAIACLFSTM